eukprot:TRINITY_DN1970_c0_g1_i3.p1 TRINITY_DN1970_c0_g1~~TRINITY_DN1970_c0_g1_i3.p1  ORF type:complete len:274 (-),score=58.79 TRINITY_DN1970_c0_g1_i3:29-850(-)
MMRSPFHLRNSTNFTKKHKKNQLYQNKRIRLQSNHNGTTLIHHSKHILGIALVLSVLSEKRISIPVSSITSKSNPKKNHIHMMRSILGFLDDSPVTGSETMYSSDEFDSRRSSIGNSMDQLRDNLPRIIIYKDTMERWLLEPYFEALVTGCYVKIPMGNDHHIIRRIEKIVENCFNVYSINRIQTTKGLEILIDNCRQIVRLDQISNQPLTPSELHFWIDEVEKGIIHVDVEEINQKADLVKVFLGQKFPQVFPQNFPQSLDTELYIQTDWNY